MIRILMIATLLYAALGVSCANAEEGESVACARPWDGGKGAEAKGFRVIELKGKHKANFVWHYNHDAPPITDYEPDAVFLAKMDGDDTVEVALVKDNCLVAVDRMPANMAGAFMTVSPVAQ